MAQGRGKQGGLVRMAISALVAALGTTGCASEEGSGGGEPLGVVQQALLCPPCPPDNPCADWGCNALTGLCISKEVIPNGEACKTPAGVPGVCVADQCCTGCIGKGPDGLVCGNGTTLNQCGAPGEACENCNLGNTCEEYQCDPQRRACTSRVLGDNEPCTDNSGACLGGSCCTGCTDNGVCVPGGTTAQCGKSTAAGLVTCLNCDDGSVCTGDPCTNGVCAAKTPQAGSCDDSTVCNGLEQCSGTQCAAGTPLNCDDGKVCTVDSCDASRGCLNTPKEGGVSCDDGNVCNGVSKCAGGTECLPGAALDCDDNNPCTTDSCDAVTGCKNVNNTVDCSDNNLCTLVDKCSGGVCVGTGAPVCDDNEPCTIDSCDPLTQCKHVARNNGVTCDDENGCTTSSECSAGKCQGTGGLTCDDGDPCTKPTCTVQAGCTFPDEDNGTPCAFDKCHVNSTCQAGSCAAGQVIDCDDNNVCTTDSCDALTGCKHVNVDGGDCSDDDQCTSADKCAAGDCVGTPKVCSALDACHVAGECDIGNGQCDDPRAADDTECDAGNGACQSGICQPLASGGAGGAGGETSAGGETGAGGVGTGGSMVGQGGEPTMMPIGGEGNEPDPGSGGAPEPGTGGNATTAGTTNQEAGAPVDPDRVFVRSPGGCSCEVPGSSQRGSVGWLVGLAVLFGLSRRRRGKRAAWPPGEPVNLEAPRCP